MQTEIEQMRAQMEQMRAALLELAALNAWRSFGECRAFDALRGHERVMTPAEADALARHALSLPSPWCQKTEF